MTSPLPIVTLQDVSPFAIAKSTRVVVRLDDLRSELHQECKVVRNRCATVEVALREYGGTRFKIRIDLNRRTVSLLSPDYSWLPQPEDITLAVAQKIVQVLGARRSTRHVMVTRSFLKLVG